jgi:hypothetical protein
MFSAMKQLGSCMTNSIFYTCCIINSLHLPWWRHSFVTSEWELAAPATGLFLWRSLNVYHVRRVQSSCHVERWQSRGVMHLLITGSSPIVRFKLQVKVMGGSFIGCIMSTMCHTLLGLGRITHRNRCAHNFNEFISTKPDLALRKENLGGGFLRLYSNLWSKNKTPRFLLGCSPKQFSYYKPIWFM